LLPQALQVGVLDDDVPTVRRRSAVLSLLLGAALAGPAAPAMAEPQLTTPLAPCYSPPLGGDTFNAEIRIPTVGLSGGEPGAAFTLVPTELASGGGFGTSGTFDAAGNATLTDVMVRQGGVGGERGTRHRLELVSGSARVFVGPEFRATGTGVFITKSDGTTRGAYRPGDRNRLAVSGVPFARKTLYGFFVKGRKVLERFKLGVADQCGYAERRMVTMRRSYQSARRPLVQIYVNAGPKLDRARSVKIDAR
jgi:hypothetical protein